MDQNHSVLRFAIARASAAKEFLVCNSLLLIHNPP
jgi:hypothetical protein